MRNFVIINGVNSNTINGLGINELPPITKPEMRNIREEIDGRDGDIITDLGYSAYDKTITIGLFGTGYDINDIISFFNGEGTIVFSNEPDKYYNFKILNQIDYESLQKFRTASITFHCQPFKYPLSETPISTTSPGSEMTVNNNGNVYSKPLLSLEGNGNVSIYLNNTQILQANVEDKMNIDIEQLEAYNPDTMTLLNRQVIGNYNSMTLQPGNNTIRIDGALDKATITNYTRWL